MNKISNYLLAVAITIPLTAFAPMCQAINDGNSLYGFSDTMDHDTYGYDNSMGNKASRAFANIFTAPLEIPKNMINTVNESNIAYGMVGGLMKGILNMTARIGAGVAEMVTIPIQTRPIAFPIYIWDDYDVDSTYGPYYRLESEQDSILGGPAETPSQQPSYADNTIPPSNNDQSAAEAAAAAADEDNNRALAAQEAADRAAQSAAETSQKLDNMFEKSMMK